MSSVKQEKNLNSAFQKTVTPSLPQILLKYSCQHVPKEILCEFFAFVESVFLTR